MAEVTFDSYTLSSDVLFLFSAFCFFSFVFVFSFFFVSFGFLSHPLFVFCLLASPV